MDDASLTEGCLDSPQADQDETPRPTKRIKFSPGSTTNTPGAASPDATKTLNATSEPADDEEAEMSLRERMQLEKELYPGASTWADDEERLFEVLFQRQDVPLLPSHWEFDFRGVPVSETVFNTSDAHPPAIYGHSEKEFQATSALMRLIDLTSTVRTTSQSRLRHRIAGIIKKGIDQFLGWAAEDGGYADLKVVPNILTEAIDAKTMRANHITDYMQYRMKAMVQLHREFWRVDRDPEFWQVIQPWIMNPDNSLHPLLLEKARRVYKKLTTLEGGKSVPDELAADIDNTPPKTAAGAKRIRVANSPTAETDELAATPGDRESKKQKKQKMAAQDDRDRDRKRKDRDLKKKDHEAQQDSHSSKTNLARFGVDDTPPSKNAKSPSADKSPFRRSPENESDIKFRRTPPVVYGLFILNTSVFLLTADPAKGDDAYVSFHVEMDFLDRHQSVWNALTVAIAACMARDELMLRTGFFDALPEVQESDPDA